MNSNLKMPSVGSLAQLKERLCMREQRTNDKDLQVTLAYSLIGSLNHEECERALLPTLEHASLVHSHLHHTTVDETETYTQTRNAIIYISLVVVIYVALVLWLVSSNFTSSSTSMQKARHFWNQLVTAGYYPAMYDEYGKEDGELEALLVVRDSGGKGQAHCTTSVEPLDEDGDHV